MNYDDGTQVSLGDHVRLINGDTGIVVASFDSREFSAHYPESEWGQMTTGVLIRTANGALVRLEDQPKLLKRAHP